MTNTVKKINMLDAVKLFFKNYFNFTGRASRSEYWWFYSSIFYYSHLVIMMHQKVLQYAVCLMVSTMLLMMFKLIYLDTLSIIGFTS